MQKKTPTKKRIPVTVYSEIKFDSMWGKYIGNGYRFDIFDIPKEIKWIEGVPYLVEVI